MIVIPLPPLVRNERLGHMYKGLLRLEKGALLCYYKASMSIIQKIFGDTSTSFVAQARKNVEKINALEAEIQALSDTQFPGETQALKDRIAAGESLDAILPRAFALTGEAARRTVD